METARVNLNTRVLSSTAIMQIKLIVLDPNIDNNIRAKIKEGIAMRTSTPRLSN